MNDDEVRRILEKMPEEERKQLIEKAQLQGVEIEGLCDVIAWIITTFGDFAKKMVEAIKEIEGHIINGEGIREPVGIFQSNEGDFEMLYECLECKNTEIVSKNDPRKDGRSCKKCGGHSVARAYIGIDLASDSLQNNPSKGGHQDAGYCNKT
jgi:DNA-directed RNA polymerase subunit RPC12/RpoP